MIRNRAVLEVSPFNPLNKNIGKPYQLALKILCRQILYRQIKPIGITLQLLLSVALLTLISSCSIFQSPHQPYDTVDTTNLYQLENLQVEPRIPSGRRTELSQLRIKALHESSMSIGAQGGLAWASQKMNVRMAEDTKYLDTIFNFHAMMLSHGVLPPILEEGDYSLNLADPNTIRVADRAYKIVEQARFATTAPNWREYIWLTYEKPELPDRTLLPRTSKEQLIWREGVRKGWIKGIEQAYSIFQQNLARLKRDYRGMVIYRKLLQSKMISPPFVSRTELGVTGNGDDMRINDQVLRIVELPQLQTNADDWKAILVKGHE